MEWPSAHSRGRGRNDSVYIKNGREAFGLHSGQEHGRRTEEVTFSETVGDKKRVNTHSQKYATTWDPGFSPEIRHKLPHVPAIPVSPIEYEHDPRFERRSRSHLPSGAEVIRTRGRHHHFSEEDSSEDDQAPQAFRTHRRHLEKDRDDLLKVRRESGHVFNFCLKKPESSEQAPKQCEPEVPSSTSGVRKWATLGLEKDVLFQENEFKVLRSRYKSNPSALQYSIAELEREEKHTPSSDSQPLLLQWK